MLASNGICNHRSQTYHTHYLHLLESWLAICSGYPIYHIPTQTNVKDLSTCFLTYHTLSSSFQDTGVEYDDSDGGKDICCSEAVEKVTGGKSKGESSGGISLSPFGLATYKMQGNLWIKPETSDYERMIYLQSAADSWLKQLSVHHHDFNFFVSHSTI
ncbi:hypothetical protein L1049_028561 [Liquidambar formosana]|uniref:Uncharacterized protein n=1 Tax=Liquidambar formosana TaxID=63359 RepID=A0AAP0WTE9_LIQFO